MAANKVIRNVTNSHFLIEYLKKNFGTTLKGGKIYIFVIKVRYILLRYLYVKDMFLPIYYNNVLIF